MISRDQVVEVLSTGLRSHPSIFALWLEGADALEMVDAYSDIDFWLDVEDGHEDEVLAYMRECLRGLAPLDINHEVRHPHPHIRQCFFHLEGSPDFLIIDVCIQSHSREVTFTKGRDAVKVIFDKAEVIRFADGDAVTLQDDVLKRAEELARDFELYRVWVLKSLARHEFLEALGSYHRYSLKPLVALLRTVYAPHKHDFHLKHIGRDLPQRELAVLKRLYSVTSLEDIATNHQEVEMRFKDLLSKLRENKARTVTDVDF